MFRLTCVGLFVLGAILVPSSSRSQAAPSKRVVGSDPLADVSEAAKHIDSLKVMVVQLHWAWKDAQEQADDAYGAAQTALEAATKCGDAKNRESVQARIDAANAKLAAANDADQRAETWEKETLQDGENTLRALATKDPTAAEYGTFVELETTQKSFYLAVITIKAGFDPGDNPPTGSGELTAAKDSLKQAREALARCTGHAAAPGSKLELFASWRVH